jgi:hypothetical protein
MDAQLLPNGGIAECPPSVQWGWLQHPSLHARARVDRIDKNLFEGEA